ncbi:MAG: Site-specific recombinase, phage integrase family [uncultured bacterium]|uniref:Tyrosine recombinase XerC n=2 Tax=Microgenomates group TaxID=1794810 RepID=A0A0G1J8W7_9BACT|nr:MAG: Site-specific recombinase, phage integrase family [uncultured bacterium]KKT30559.1 MAG: Tyrosine recombinase XerC [Microgenomates group bacterium GW2011_GWC1_44_10]KKT49856.1 MAG: Tyrosine recombinase XerC [Candidatus Collierbacteria bacterium GW2011_GWC2_44_18]KKT67695.1 MAG: Tyrosine recombinase XerC [Candidatus Woesebacteria bacterium GW2011_GWA2_44_33]
MDQNELNIKLAVSTFKSHLFQQGRASATILAYSKDIEQLADFLAKSNVINLKEVTKDNIDAFKSHLAENSYTTKSISRKINSIKSFFSYVQANGLISDNPSVGVSHPKYDIKPPRILNKIEYRALRDACREDLRMAAIVEILLQTGMRISELANLKISDIDKSTNQVTIRAYESHPERVTPINQPAREALDRYLTVRPKSANNSVFITKTGNAFLIRNIRSNLDRYFHIAGIENAKVNDLRHTFIAQQLTSGSPLVYISKLVGHKRLSTTEKYLEFISEKPAKDKPKIIDL